MNVAARLILLLFSISGCCLAEDDSSESGTTLPPNVNGNSTSYVIDLPGGLKIRVDLTFSNDLEYGPPIEQCSCHNVDSEEVAHIPTRFHCDPGSKINETCVHNESNCSKSTDLSIPPDVLLYLILALALISVLNILANMIQLIRSCLRRPRKTRRTATPFKIDELDDQKTAAYEMSGVNDSFSADTQPSSPPIRVSTQGYSDL